MSSSTSERVHELLVRAGLGDAPPHRTAAVAIAVFVVGAVGLWRFWPSAPAPEVGFDEVGAASSAVASATAAPVAPVEVVVHVAGAVAAPGVYRLPAGSRVTDAVDAAGGPLADAASDAVNLARILTDGEQVFLPTHEQAATGVVAAPAAGGARGDVSAGQGPVDLNTATVADLEALPGIGEATAQKIVDEREKNGPFASPEDLMRVPGIGEKKFESLKDLVTVR